MLRAAVITLVVAVTTSLSAQAPARAAGPVPTVPLANGLNVILHQDNSVPVVAVNVWYHVGSAQREARAHRLRAPVRAPDVRGIEARQGRRVRHAARSGRRQQQRLDRRTTAPTTTSTCRRTRSSWRCSSSRIAWATCSTRCRPSASTASATSSRTSAGRATRTSPYGMASIEIDKMLWPAGPSLQLADDRLHGGPHGGQLRGRRRVLQEVLRAGQRQPGDRRRHRLRRRRGRWSRSGSATCRPARAGRADRAARARCSTEREEEDASTDRVQLPRLYLAWLTPRVYAPGDAALDVVVVGAGRRQELAALQAARLRHCRSRRT